MEFEEWFGEELPQLLRFATVLCGSSDLAQDLVQDVAIKVQQRWPKLSQLDYRDAYVRRMLVNEHLSFRRKFARIVVRATVEPPGGYDRPHFTDQHADRAALLDELSHLPPRQQAVLVLRYYDDVDDATIAQILGCRASTVRAHATRGLKTLRISPRTGQHPQTKSEPPTGAVPADGEEDTRAHRN